jgi:hypothetical protein
MRCVGVVECKAPGTQNSGKSPLLFFALVGRAPSSRAVRPTCLRICDEKRVRNDRVTMTVGALYASYSQSRCCDRLKRDAEAVCTHRVAQRMTTAASSSCS